MSETLKTNKRKKMEFKMSVISAIIGIMLGLVVAQACSSSQFGVDNPDSVKTGQCAGVCTAIAGAHCWTSRGVEQILGPAVEAATCFDKCMANSELSIKLQMDCIMNADACEALDQCLTVAYK
jgi:hypothetical protein